MELYPEIDQSVKEIIENVKWSIKIRLKNGFEGCYPVPTKEKDRLLESLPEICEGSDLFFEFHTDDGRVLIQSSQLIFYQFLFDPMFLAVDREGEEGNSERYAVKIYVIDSSKPIILYVNEDMPTPKDPGDGGQMNNFLYYAKHLLKGSHEEWIHLTDEDGEVAFFRASSIALVEIPREVIDPICLVP